MYMTNFVNLFITYEAYVYLGMNRLMKRSLVDGYDMH